MRLKRTMVWIGIPVAVLATLVAGFYYFILDWSGRPFCHKQHYLGFQIWMEEHKTDAFPNDSGLSSNSLMAIRDGMGGGTLWSEHYRYVPGLHQDDPGHLILLYFDRPTRWTWHGPPPTIFVERAWIVVPVDFAQDSSRPRLGGGEMSERLTTEQFKQRLGETIEFIRTNARPHWQEIVAEHTRFLESIEHAKK
jgi:hypothetical protein